MKRIFRRTALRPDANRDVRDELSFHLEMRAQEFIDAGMAPDDARRAAAEAFGDVTSIDGELRAARQDQSRIRERRDRTHELRMDVAFALRTLRKNAAFTAAALATLALGIGATTAVFTVVNGVLLRPLPYGDPSRLALVWISSKRPGLGSELPLSTGFFTDLRTQSKSFASMAAFRNWNYTLKAEGDAEQIPGARVSPSLFPVLGVRPILGRPFTEADAEVGAAHVAVIGYSLWQRAFGGVSSVVGRRVELSGESFTIIGVMPSGFAFPRGAELPAGLTFATRTELWAPMTLTEQDRKNYGTLNIAAIGRLKSNVSLTEARGETSAHIRNFLEINAPKLDFDYRVVPLQEQSGRTVKRALLLLLGAVVFVMFIACANVTNLLVARTSLRRREFAVRAALGAGRARIARQLITENTLLAAIGTVLGLALSFWATRAMLALVPGSLPRADDVSMDWRVAAVAAVIAIGLGTAFGVASTLQIRWSEPADTLRDAAGRATGGRARSVGRRVLVVAEVSLSLMLLIGAALLTTSFVRLQRVEPGFNPQGAFIASVGLPLPGAWDPARDGPTWSRFFTQLMERLAKAPGVEAAGAVSSPPLTGAVETAEITIAGQPAPPPGQTLQSQYSVIAGDYFRAMQIKLLAGRTFDARDAAKSVPVIMVNREFVRRYLNDSPAVDTRITCSCVFFKSGPRTIVGVVDNTQHTSLDGSPEPAVYLAESQMPYPGLGIVVRTNAEPGATLAMLKREIAAVDPRAAVSNARTLDDVFNESLARQRFSMTVIAVFATSALLLAVVGLYGVIALSVGQRRREIGVRMALGARPLDVLHLILGEGARITIAGVAFGLIGAWGVSRALSALLFGVSATNATVYVAAAIAIALVTLVATYIPARRATQVDPTLALRDE